MSETRPKYDPDPRAVLDAACSEADLQARVIMLARLRGWWVWHCTDPVMSAAGLPDLLLVRERVVWLELKTERGRLRAAQSEVIDRLRAAGAEVHVCRPHDWPTIERVLE